ncbi:MAG: molybdenum cofactor biosynthesis protein MoaE [Hyphomicrobium sp.]
MTIRIQKENFNVSSEISALTQGCLDIGAVVSFVGLVRDKVSDRQLKSMTLEHYPGMTERELESLENKAHQRWKLKRTLIIHRIGELFPGDQIVLVVTAGHHRKETYEANVFLMDFLKTQAPFWKKESFMDGKSEWVSANEEDEVALKRWRS